MSNVSAGAELIADGNVHVYGVLRGRVLAGASGDQESHIFVHICLLSLFPLLVNIG